MTVLHAIALGVLQGITEFLPVSSSGHLVLAETLLDIHLAPKDQQVLNVLLHAGTLVALFVVYAPVWRQLLLAPIQKDPENVRRLVLIVIATIPGAVAGMYFKDWIASYFQSLLYVGGAFACTGIVILLGECCRATKQSLLECLTHPFRDEPHKLTTRSAFFIGIAQALALIPGLSRSGLTISAARLMGLERKDALDFSFLMAVPIIFGATVVSLRDMVANTVVLPKAHIVVLAVAVSFVSSSAAILFLRQFVIRRSLSAFVPYLFVISVVTIALHFLS